MTHGLDTSFLVAAEVAGHADHVAARTLAASLRNKGDRFALAPQALAEFAHIVTDPKRFTAPLTLPQALERGQVWWDASDVERHGAERHQHSRGHALNTRRAAPDGAWRVFRLSSAINMPLRTELSRSPIPPQKAKHPRASRKAKAIARLLHSYCTAIAQLLHGSCTALARLLHGSSKALPKPAALPARWLSAAYLLPCGSDPGGSR